ncbi:hypothetical protein Tco_0620095 [Tanacetum coccineum]
MADNRTMAQMLQAPIEGYEDAIVVPPINANNFELKQPLINLVSTANKFTGRQDPHNHLRFFNKVTSTFRHPEVPNTSVKLLLFPFSLDGEAEIGYDKEPPRFISHMGRLVSKIQKPILSNFKNHFYRTEIITFYPKSQTKPLMKQWNVFKGTPSSLFSPCFSELTNRYLFNSLNSNDQDALDSAAGGNFLDKMPQEGFSDYRSKSKVRYSRSRANDSRGVRMLLSSTSSPGTLPSQTVTNPRQQINAITTRSGKTLEEPSIPLVPTPDVSKPQKEPEQNPETSTEKVQNPNLENTAHGPNIPGDVDSFFMEIPKPKQRKR